MRYRLGIAGIVAVFFASALLAQNYPMPSAQAQVCNSNACPRYPGLSVYPFSTPFKRHVGRIIDSQLTKEWQAQPIRTLRARGMKIDEQGDRIYMMLGSTLAAYKKSTFFTSTLGRPLSQISGRAGITGPLPGEQYLQWDAYAYPEEPGSGWITPNADDQIRLNDYDFDDRGYVYAAYTVFGWGLMKEQGDDLKLVKQFASHTGDTQGVFAQRIISIKSEGRYYAVVASQGGTTLGIWDTTNATATGVTFVRTLPFPDGVNDWERAGNDVVAVASGSGTVRVFNPAAFLTGGAAIASFNVKANAITGDGSSFFVSSGAANPINIYQIAPNGGITSYRLVTHPTTARITPRGLETAGGYVTVFGYDDYNRPAVKVFRAIPSGLIEVPLGEHLPAGAAGILPASFLTFYYWNPPAGHAKPDGYCADPFFVTVYPHGGKDYLIYFGFGLADVYELQTRDAVDIDRAAGASPGTPNPNNPNSADGPFFGDIVTFTSATTQGSVKRIRWDFANPESGAANMVEVDTGGSVQHRYVGLTAAAAIAQTRNVTAAEVSDSTNADTVPLTLKVPTPRIKIKGTSHTITSATNASTLPIVASDKFVDASDGTIEGHYNAWQVGATTTLGTPGEEVSVGICGAQTLIYSGNYVTYTGSGATTAPTPGLAPFVASLNPTYTVRPFVPAIQLTTSSPSATNLTFQNTTRIADYSTTAHFAKGGATPVRIQWQVVRTSGTTNEPVRNTTLSQVGTDSFTVAKSSITPGTKVVMTLTIIDSADIVATACRTTAFASAKAEMTLNPPDPQIVKVSGCQYTNTGCELTVQSASGASRSGWTYQWSVDGTVISGAVGETFSPNFTTEGNHSATVAATNVIGSTTSAPANFAIVTPPCSGVPTNLTFAYEGCTVTCKPGDQIRFIPRTLFDPRGFQECDVFKWETDGRTFNQKEPVITYAANGTYTVKLTVSNSNGSSSMQDTIQIGELVNNQCPPPPARVDIIYAGPAGCQNGGTCPQGESIRFDATAFGYNFDLCPDSFVWTFSDGTSSTQRTAFKTFSQQGTYTASLRVSNSGGATNAAPVTITVVPIGPPPDTCGLPPASFLSIGYTGAISNCEVNKSCLYDETITFTAYVFGAQFQDCQTLTWSFGDGTSLTGRSVQKIYTNRAVGTYTVRLTISSPSGVTVFKDVVVNVANAPISVPTNATIASITPTPVAGTELTFVGAATSPEGLITEWEWNFGDGTPFGRSQSVMHTYETDGEYQVTLKARNAGGWSAPAVKIIKVAAKNRFAFLLPVAAHIGGNFGSQWRTDLQIFNPDPAFIPESPLALTLEFRGTTGVTKEIQVDSATYIIEDLYRLFFPTGDGAGTVIVSGNAPFAPQMWTRTYNVSATGVGTFGQLIPAIRLTDYPNAVTNPPSYILAGLQNSAKYRTNLGLINPTNVVQSVSVEAFDDTPFGFTIGKFDVSVNPYSLLQIGDLVARFPRISDGKPYSLKLKTASGAYLVGYASMIDNASGDPVFIEAIQDDAMKGEDFKTQILPGVGRIGSWRSDVTIFNADIKSVLLDLSYYDSAGMKVAEARSVPLAANAFTQIADLLKSTLWTTPIADTTGVLRIDNPTPGIERHPVIFGRTYNDQGAKGTFGQGIPAFSAARANVKANAPGYLPGVRSDSNYYTNIGLTNLSSEPSVVKVSLLEQRSGHVVGEATYPIAPNQSLIGTDVIRGLSQTAASGSLRVEIVTGGPVWAFASIVDRTTKDPEYVPAIPTSSN